MSVHAILVAARNRIAERGWASHSYGPLEGPHCAVAAIHRVSGNNREAIDFLAEMLGLGQRGLEASVAIGEWNDLVAQSEQEVLAVFDEAICQTAPAPDLSFLNDRVAKTEQDTKFWTGVVS